MVFKKDERRIFSTNELNDRNKGLQEKTVITIAHRISSLNIVTAFIN